MGTVLLHYERLAKYKKNLVYMTNLNVPIKLTSRGLCNCFASGNSPDINGLSEIERIYTAQAGITLGQLGIQGKHPSIMVLRTAKPANHGLGQLAAFRNGHRFLTDETIESPGSSRTKHFSYYMEIRKSFFQDKEYKY